MFDFLTCKYPEKPPHGFPLDAHSLGLFKIPSPKESELEGALKRIDMPLVSSALRGIRDCFMYNLPSLRSTGHEQDFFMSQFVERQRKILLTVIGDRMDKSGLSKLLTEIAPPFFQTYNFKSQDFIESEKVLLSDVGITEEDLNKIADIVQGNKGYLFKLMAEPEFSCRSVLGNDPLNWSAFGGTIASVNVAAIAAPEPLITTSLGVGSLVFGLAASLWPAK